jgi:Zn-dependent protease with chaperone function
MGERKKKKKLQTFPGLQAKDFQHPDDVSATESLKAIPLLDKVVAKVMELSIERIFYLQFIAGSVRVTPKMFGRLHRSLGWGCKILDLPEPEMYVMLDPVPNAFTYGHTRPFIVVSSGLVDLLDDEELFYVIGHELGHIKSGHVLYTLIARNIAEIVAIIGQATMGIGAIVGQSLVLALHEWYRKAELTSDRAGLLCVQDMEPCLTALMKMAGGASRLYDEMDREEFLTQIRAYEEANVSILDQAWKGLITAYRTHPFPIFRAKELDAWHQGDYQNIIARPNTDEV